MKNHKKKGKIADADMFVEKTLQAAQVEATIVTRSDIYLWLPQFFRWSFTILKKLRMLFTWSLM